MERWNSYIYLLPKEEAENNYSILENITLTGYIFKWGGMCRKENESFISELQDLEDHDKIWCFPQDGLRGWGEEELARLNFNDFFVSITIFCPGEKKI